jgi:hypothetical protein
VSITTKLSFSPADEGRKTTSGHDPIMDRDDVASGLTFLATAVCALGPASAKISPYIFEEVEEFEKCQRL